MGFSVRSGSVRPLARPRVIAGLSADVITALRERVATGYYNQPEVVASVALAVVSGAPAARERFGSPRPLPS